MEKKIEKLKKKLENANITFNEIIPDDPDFASRIIFEIPAAREKQECVIPFREEIIDDALKLDFEKFRFLKSYEAIWSKESKIIECEIGNVDSPNRFFFDRLNRIINKPDENEEEESEDEITNIDLPSIDGLTLSIGFCSKEFAFLSWSRARGPRSRNAKRITLKIKNSKASTHDVAKELIEKIANSLFFQIDLAFELPLNLQVQRDSWIDRRKKSMRRQMFVDQSATITEPKYEYDSEPISLYWYAKESINMPIFQYLAFYQTIEFYFPIYSSFEAKQKIQSLIKDPRFNPNRDADISKIISTIKVSSGGKSFGNERDQLKATISSCTDNQELLSFFKADNERLNFYADNKGKSISNQKISIKNETSDFVTEVSERIYEIRCRIVHSKASEGDFDVLLPYSSEVKILNFDIELIEFISRKVLITSSRPIKL
ncbi:hypothetical protein ACFO3O_11180 [Dokdonia ponticola]|uniref:Apea-like HEPN domain-containing protein n=1 Tax=Dokdonia ponticola TaxID=2041041 RepID=A0ABV9HY67_9FLAO